MTERLTLPFTLFGRQHFEAVHHVACDAQNDVIAGAGIAVELIVSGWYKQWFQGTITGHKSFKVHGQQGTGRPAFAIDLPFARRLDQDPLAPRTEFGISRDIDFD